MVKISPQKVAPLEETHPFKGWTVLSLPLFIWISWHSLIIWNLTKFEALLFPHSFSLILHKFPHPFSHFLSSTYQFTTFPSLSLLYFLSTTHTLYFSIPLLIPLLLPSFHHFPSLFSLKSRSNQGDFKIFPNKVTLVKNLYQGTLIPLILCDRSSFPKNLLLLGFVWTLG